MRTLKFPTHPIEPFTEAAAAAFNNSSNHSKNGLVSAIIRAYNYHHVLSISPDDVMNNICCLWAKYVVLNAERFRDKIVTHSGKRTLTLIVPQNTEWDEENLLLHMNGYIDLVNQDQDSVKWMDITFSTTTPLDQMLRNVATLSSQKEYYAYHSRTLCWLPYIQLHGTREDWVKLYNAVVDMPTFDENQEVWKILLLDVLMKFVEADEKDEEFWQSPLINRPGGSGSVDYYCGWVTVFNPFNEKGEWGMLSKTNHLYVPIEDVMDLTVDFSITCLDDSGSQHGTLAVSAGPTKIKAEPMLLNLLGVRADSKLTFIYKPS
jgi:hypothetical protein